MKLSDEEAKAILDLAKNEYEPPVIVAFALILYDFIHRSISYRKPYQLAQESGLPVAVTFDAVKRLIDDGWLERQVCGLDRIAYRLPAWLIKDLNWWE